MATFTLTSPLPEGAYLTDTVFVGECTECGADASFVRYEYADAPTWFLAGLNGSRSDTYGTYCPQHA